MFTLRNQGDHVVGLLVLSLFVGGQTFAQDQPSCGTPVECYEQSLANLMKERQSLQEARKEMDEKMADLQKEVEALKKEAGEVRVQTGRVRINRTDIPELLQPNCSSHIERGEKHDRVDFQESFASPPKVIMALSAIDVSHNANSRFHVIAIPESVDTKGFDYKFVTWCDTAIHWAEAHWIAVAQ